MVRAIAFAVATAVAAVSVDAHTNMAVPAIKTPDGFYNGNSFNGHINQDTFPAAKAEGLYFNTEKIVKVMAGYKSLRELVYKNVNLSTAYPIGNTKECGWTLTTGDKQPLPDAVDFPWGHPGPCEVWCDNTRIFYNDECQGNNVGKVPIDKTKCKGTSIIQAMYVGVHVNPWETYVNCAPIVGGTKTDFTTALNPEASGSGATGGSATGSDTTGNDAASPTATTKAPAAPTNAPSTPTTKAPSTPVTKAPSAPTTKAPAPTTAPSTPAATSAPSKSNCKRRVRN